MAITHNLAIALRHLRFPHKGHYRIIWADAICVNQQDLGERAQQVERMADIYRASKRVIVWLGPEADNSTLAIETISALSSQVEYQSDGLWPLRLSPQGDSRYLDYSVDLPFDDRKWNALHCFFTRPWFTRLWIWQEVYLGSSVDVLCGFKNLSWEVLRNAVVCLYLKPKPHYELFDLTNQAFRVCVCGKNRIDILLEESKSAKCEDPRDRLYSLINLAWSGDCIADMKPNYSEKPRKVFKEFVLRCIDKHRDLNILIHCERSVDEVITPTWVPDWSRPKTCRSLCATACCWMSKLEANLVNHVTLQVTGTRVATISAAQEIITESKNESDMIFDPVAACRCTR